MTLVRYEPWNLLHQFRHEMDHVFGNGEVTDDKNNVGNSDWTPAVDIKEEDTQFLLHVDIPGVDANNIEVHMEDGVLSIKGERKTEHTENKQGYKRVERSYGSFYRRFSLPDSTDAENIKAKSKNGVLEISIAKSEKVQARRIAVDS